MKRILSFVLAAAALVALAGCSGAERPFPALVVAGDCEGAVVHDKISLEQAIALARPRAQEFDLLVVGADGLTVRFSGEDMAGCELLYTKEYAWELQTDTLPRSARVKNIAQVVVVSVSEDPKAARFVEGDAAQTVTAGQLYLRGAERVLKEEGTSALDGRRVTVYTPRYRMPLSGFFSAEGGGPYTAMSMDGRWLHLTGLDDCRLESGGKGVDLVHPAVTLEGLAGVMAGAPPRSIKETFRDAMEALEAGDRVMIIELDGLGFDGIGHAPYLKSLEPERAMACYPPVSQVGLASMLTGETPDRHGIHSREDRKMQCDDIFERARELGKRCAYIEGSHALLDTSIRPVLSLDDEDVFANAREALEDEPDLLFVHFHGIDEAAHAYGPNALETARVIETIDGYVKALCEGFGGRVIITADHGLHETDEGGDHGVFCAEDMMVPYAIRN